MDNQKHTSFKRFAILIMSITLMVLAGAMVSADTSYFDDFNDGVCDGWNNEFGLSCTNFKLEGSGALNNTIFSASNLTYQPIYLQFDNIFNNSINDDSVYVSLYNTYDAGDGVGVFFYTETNQIEINNDATGAISVCPYTFTTNTVKVNVIWNNTKEVSVFFDDVLVCNGTDENLTDIQRNFLFFDYATTVDNLYIGYEPPTILESLTYSEFTDELTTNFSEVVDWSAVSLILDHPNGRIEFDQAVDMTNYKDLDTHVEISNKSIYIDTDTAPVFSLPAVLVFKNTGYTSAEQVVVKKDGIIITPELGFGGGYGDEEVSFYVDSFSNYTLEDAPPAPVLVYPTGGEILYSSPITIDWNGSVSKTYNVSYSSDNITWTLIPMGNTTKTISDLCERTGGCGAGNDGDWNTYVEVQNGQGTGMIKTYYVPVDAEVNVTMKFHRYTSSDFWGRYWNWSSGSWQMLIYKGEGDQDWTITEPLPADGINASGAVMIQMTTQETSTPDLAYESKLDWGPVTSTEWDFSEVEGGVYYIKVEDNEGLYDIAENVTIPPNAAPTAPVLIYPVGGEVILSSPLVVTWNESTDAENDPILYNLSYNNGSITTTQGTYLIADSCVKGSGSCVSCNDGNWDTGDNIDPSNIVVKTYYVNETSPTTNFTFKLYRYPSCDMVFEFWNYTSSAWSPFYFAGYPYFYGEPPTYTGNFISTKEIPEEGINDLNGEIQIRVKNLGGQSCTQNVLFETQIGTSEQQLIWTEIASKYVSTHLLDNGLTNSVTGVVNYTFTPNETVTLNYIDLNMFGSEAFNILREDTHEVLRTNLGGFGNRYTISPPLLVEKDVKYVLYPSDGEPAALLNAWPTVTPTTGWRCGTTDNFAYYCSFNYTDNTYEWDISSLPDGSPYYLKVTADDGALSASDSSSAFSINQNAPTTPLLNYPQGGEMIASGPVTIYWNSSVSDLLVNYNVSYSTDNSIWTSLANELNQTISIPSGGYTTILSVSGSSNGATQNGIMTFTPNENAWIQGFRADATPGSNAICAKAVLTKNNGGGVLATSNYCTNPALGKAQCLWSSPISVYNGHNYTITYLNDVGCDLKVAYGGVAPIPNDWNFKFNGVEGTIQVYGWDTPQYPFYQWNISAIPDGSPYYVKVTADDGYLSSSDSSGAFTINQVAPTASLVYPIGGEVLTSSPVTIIWDESVSELPVYYNLSYSEDNVTWTDIANNAGTFNELWSVHGQMNGYVSSGPFRIGIAGNIDGDNKPDVIAVVDYLQQGWYSLENNASGCDDCEQWVGTGWTLPPPFNTPATVNYAAICDLNGDNLGDFVVGNANVNGCKIYLNTGTAGAPSWPTTEDYSIGCRYTMRALGCGDFDGDGYDDIAHLPDDINYITYMNSSGRPSQSVAISTPNVNRFLDGLTVVDADMDGDLDIIDRPDLVSWVNTGNRTFSKNLYSLTDGIIAASVGFENAYDYDGDGKVESWGALNNNAYELGGYLSYNWNISALPDGSPYYVQVTADDGSLSSSDSSDSFSVNQNPPSEPSINYPIGGEDFIVNEPYFPTIYVTWNQSTSEIPVNYTVEFSTNNGSTWATLVDNKNASYFNLAPNKNEAMDYSAITSGTTENSYSQAAGARAYFIPDRDAIVNYIEVYPNSGNYSEPLTISRVTGYVIHGLYPDCELGEYYCGHMNEKVIAVSEPGVDMGSGKYRYTFPDGLKVSNRTSYWLNPGRGLRMIYEGSENLNPWKFRKNYVYSYFIKGGIYSTTEANNPNLEYGISTLGKSDLETYKVKITATDFSQNSSDESESFGIDSYPAASTITAPLSNSVMTDLINITWSPSTDPDSVVYQLYYSADRGSTWNHIENAVENSYLWNTSSLTDGAGYKLKIITNETEPSGVAEREFLTATVQHTNPFNINAHPPSAPTILSPSEGDIISTEEIGITFDLPQTEDAIAANMRYSIFYSNDSGSNYNLVKTINETELTLNIDYNTPQSLILNVPYIYNSYVFQPSEYSGIFFTAGKDMVATNITFHGRQLSNGISARVYRVSDNSLIGIGTCYANNMYGVDGYKCTFTPGITLLRGTEYRFRPDGGQLVYTNFAASDWNTFLRTYTYGDYSVGFHIEGIEADTVNYTVDSSSFPSLSTYMVKVSANDGNFTVSAESGEFDINRLHEVALVSPLSEEYKHTNFTMTYSVSDVDGISDVDYCEVWTNKNQEGYVLSDNETTPSLSNNYFREVAPAEISAVSWYVNCVDVLGRDVQTDERHFYIDAANPIINYYAPLADNSTNLSKSWVRYRVNITSVNDKLNYTAFEVVGPGNNIVYQNISPMDLNSTTFVFDDRLITKDWPIGVYYINTNATDWAGNTVHRQISFQIKDFGPDAPILTRPNIDGTYDEELNITWDPSSDWDLYDPISYTLQLSSDSGITYPITLVTGYGGDETVASHLCPTSGFVMASGNFFPTTDHLLKSIATEVPSTGYYYMTLSENGTIISTSSESYCTAGFSCYFGFYQIQVDSGNNYNWMVYDADTDLLSTSPTCFGEDGGWLSTGLKTEVVIDAQVNPHVYTWNTTAIPEGFDYRIKVIASDGTSTAFDSTFSDFRIAHCAPNWVVQYGACTVNDTKLKYYTDYNYCNKPSTVPVDNSTTVACDYCLPSFSCSEYECMPGDKRMCVDTADSNECYEQTGLTSDQYSGDYLEFGTPYCDYSYDGGGGGSNQKDENIKPQCNDGIDNDGDGYADWPDDIDCVTLLDDKEYSGCLSDSECGANEYCYDNTRCVPDGYCVDDSDCQESYECKSNVCTFEEPQKPLFSIAGWDVQGTDFLPDFIQDFIEGLLSNLSQIFMDIDRALGGGN